MKAPEGVATMATRPKGASSCWAMRSGKTMEVWTSIDMSPSGLLAVTQAARLDVVDRAHLRGAAEPLDELREEGLALLDGLGRGLGLLRGRRGGAGGAAGAGACAAAGPASAARARAAGRVGRCGRSCFLRAREHISK